MFERITPHSCYNKSVNKLIIICGLSFAGKSTLGDAVSNKFGFKTVDVDSTKFSMFGDVKDDDLKKEDWIKIYDTTDKEIADILQSGKNVVDASRNFRKAERDKIRGTVKNLGYAVVTIYIDTPVEIARKRWLANRTSRLRRDIVDKDFEEIINAMEPPTEDENALVMHYDENITDWISMRSMVLS